jgi:hypothetical protein
VAARYGEQEQFGCRRIAQMSQNGPFPGPPWPGGSSDDEPYREPADPWGEHAVADPSWSAPGIPHQPAPAFHSAPLPTPPPADPASAPAAWGPPKRNTPIVALVVVLGLLIVAGLGAIGWLVKEQIDHRAAAEPRPSASATTSAPATVAGTEDARFATAGQCVQNLGTGDQPDMRKSVCASGTYRVLRVIKGRTSGAKDAESKCSRVAGYTNWFYYDSDLDDLDLVLCLKKQ